MKNLQPAIEDEGCLTDHVGIPKLNDKKIREAFVQSLRRRGKVPHAILHEIHVCSGNAIADVIAVYKTIHCYEIKGEADSIARVLHQAKYFDQASPLNSLITTKNHLKRALNILPAHWGIILTEYSREGAVIFKSVRGAGSNPLYRPEVALLTLWRSELICFPLMPTHGLDKLNRQKMAALIVGMLPKKSINEKLGLMLASRKREFATLDNGRPCK